jgi:hypothetical protein
MQSYWFSKQMEHVVTLSFKILAFHNYLHISPLIVWIKLKKWGQFACKTLVICQTALLQISLMLHTKPSTGTLCGSHYIQWSSYSHSSNMWAPLLDCINIEKHVIWLLWSEGIHRKMLAPYEEEFITHKTVCQWVQSFQSGRTSVLDEVRLVCLTTSWMEDCWTN